MKHVQMVTKPRVAGAQIAGVVEILSILTTLLSAIGALLPLFQKNTL